MADQTFGFTFDDEAWEIFQGILANLVSYGVTVTTQDGERIEGYLAPQPFGNDDDYEWGDEVAVYDNGGDWSLMPDEVATPERRRRVRVGTVHVH